VAFIAKGNFRVALFSLLFASVLGPWFSALAAPIGQGVPQAEEIYAEAVALHLDEEVTWRALLHSGSSRSYISDGSFILSLPSYSPRNELLATLKFFEANPLKGACRFPARYVWLNRRISLPYGINPEIQCPEVVEFRQRAPTSTVSVVYVSEALAKPSSVMGHLLLKLDGMSDDRAISHAISFFTDTGTANIPKLFFDSIIVGRQGFFTLSPYEEQVENYVQKESRSLWEYRLLIPQEQVQLMTLHLLELRDVKFLYFFQRYNCASLIKFVLGVADQRIMEANEAVTTPKSVIKAAISVGMVEDSTVRASSEWTIRMISSDLPSSAVSAVKRSVQDRISSFESLTIAPEQLFLELKLVEAYHSFLMNSSTPKSKDADDYEKSLSQELKPLEEKFQLQASDFKNPSSTPPETQVSAGVKIIGQVNYIELRILPVSHRLEDNNEQLLSENELRFFDVSLLKPENGSSLHIDELTIFHVKSLLPRSELTGGLSSSFKIGYEPLFDQELHRRHAFQTAGAWGVTERAPADIDWYALGGAGVDILAGMHVNFQLESGFIMREMFGMKTMLSFERHWGDINSGNVYSQFRVTQSKFFDKNESMVFGFCRSYNGFQAVNEAEFRLNRFF